MSHYNNDTPNSQMYLLAEIFADAWNRGRHPGPLDSFESRMLAVGQVLGWLNLIIPDRKSVFGYKPTERLMEIIEQRPKRRLKSRKENLDIDDVNDLESIFEAALGERWSDRNIKGFVLDVLGVLGLVRYTEDGHEVATPLLRRFAAARQFLERCKRHRGEMPTRELRQLAAERKEERTDVG